MKTLIAIPCMDMVHTIFMKSLIGMSRVGEVRYSISCSSLVYDSRNNLAKQAIDEGFDRILWFDSDMEFNPNFMKVLSADMDEGLEMVSGLYFKRKAPTGPVVYEKIGYYHSEAEDAVTPLAVPYVNYPKDQLFECEGVGFGGVMVSTDLVKRVADKFGLPFSPILGFGEDLSFCMRVKEIGGKIYCDSRAKMGHVGLGTITEDIYLAQTGGRNVSKQHDPGEGEDVAKDINNGI